MKKILKEQGYAELNSRFYRIKKRTEDTIYGDKIAIQPVRITQKELIRMRREDFSNMRTDLLIYFAKHQLGRQFRKEKSGQQEQKSEIVPETKKSWLRKIFDWIRGLLKRQKGAGNEKNMA